MFPRETQPRMVSGVVIFFISFSSSSSFNLAISPRVSATWQAISKLSVGKVEEEEREYSETERLALNPLSHYLDAAVGHVSLLI